MIRKLTLNNFYSFKSPRTILFTVNKNAPQSSAYTRSVSGDRCSKINVLIGPNGSGKTNLLKAISFIKYFITQSYYQKIDEQIPFEPFHFDDAKNSTSIEIEYESEKVIYFYRLKLTKKRVIEESLHYLGKDNRFRYLFKRHLQQDGEYIYKSSKKFELGREIEKAIRPNASVISVGTQLNNKSCKLIFDYWNKVITNVVEIGMRSMLDNRILPAAVERAAKSFYANNELKNWADQIISSLDLGLLEVKVIKGVADHPNNDKDKTGFYPFGIHRGRTNKKHPLPIYYESRGTQCVYAILDLMLPVLKNGGVVILDEFDNDLHPHMVPVLFDLFLSKITNPNNAQLLVSSHSITILRRLDKYQIYFVEKNGFGESDIWRLEGIKNVRADDNFLNKYEAGTYGGIPRL